MDLFNENNCAFNSLTESIDTHTPSGRMFIKIIGIFAEFERENIIDRVSVALEKRVREGYAHIGYGIVPYGYSREIGQRELTVNDEESKVVKDIFNMYLNKHKSFNAIATDLNARNIPSSSNTSWSGYAINYMLSNPLYIGKVRYSVKDEKKYFEADGKHQGIISEKIFFEVQSKKAKMQKTIKKRPKEENYYCGTLMCAVCGSKMTTHGAYRNIKGEEVYYGSYYCLGSKYSDCKTGTLSHRKVDSAFRQYIDGYEDFVVKPDLETQNNEFEQDLTITKAEYEANISKLTKKEQDIMRLYVGDKIDFEEYNQMLEIIRIEKKAYQGKLTELESTEAFDTELNQEDLISNLRENWDELTNIERMQFLQTYVDAIYVLREPDTKEIKVKRLEFYKR